MNFVSYWSNFGIEVITIDERSLSSTSAPEVSYTEFVYFSK